MERWTEQSTERFLIKFCSRALRTSDWGEGSPSNRTMTLSTQPTQHSSGFRSSLWMSLSGSARARTWTRFEHLWRDLKIAVQRRSSSNLTELERICREEWEKLPKYKLVPSYRRRLKAVIAAKGASTKCRVKGLNTYVNVIFHCFALSLFCFVIMGYCV